MLELRECHPWVSPEWAYSAVTQRSAEALGLESHFGTLLAGRLASINVSRCDATVPPSEVLDELTTRQRPFTPIVDVLAVLQQF